VKLKITVDNKVYEVDVEASEPEPEPLPPPATSCSHVAMCPRQLPLRRPRRGMPMSMRPKCAAAR